MPPTNENGYTFLPWAQRGLSNFARFTEAEAAHRPRFDVEARLQVLEPVLDPASNEDVISGNFELYGPGDIVGFNKSALIRTVPAPNEAEFASNLLARAEFYDEDFPWRYSAKIGQSDDKRVPWLFLLVLKADEYQNIRIAGAPLGAIQITKPEVLPAAPEGNEDSALWAWGHIQVNKLDLEGSEVADFLTEELPQNPDQAFSRLLCPRHLDPYTDYQAFLVPTFELGRLSGLGLPLEAEVGGTHRAWLDNFGMLKQPTALNDDPEQPEYYMNMPVYHTWSFRTGRGEDFEALASRLVPRPTSELLPLVAPLEVNINDERFGLSSATREKLPGALILPATSYSTSATTAYQTQLATVLDSAVTGRPLPGSGTSSGGAASRPAVPRTPNGRRVVAPPTYGRYHAKAPTIGNSTITWLRTLNLQPRYRIIAGVGSRIVRQNQEEYMTRAWEQLRDVLLANQNLRLMQVGLHVTSSLRQRHLPVVGDIQAVNVQNRTFNANASPGIEDYSLQLMGNMLTRMRVAGEDKTIHQLVRESALPLATLSPRFRQIMRPFGNYVVNQAGLPARPNAVAITVDPTEDPFVSKTTLASRGQLLSLINSGLLKAAESPDPMSRVYLYDRDLFKQSVNGLYTELEKSETQVYTGQSIAPSSVQDIRVKAKAAIARFRNVFPDKDDDLKEVKLEPLPLEDIKSSVIEQTAPGPVFLARANRALRRIPSYGTYGTSNPAIPIRGNNSNNNAAASRGIAPQLTTVQPVMAYPVFKEPMSHALRQYNPDLLLPGLAKIPLNTIALFTTNPPFVEALLAGANHEMATELLWRGYPTDQRGTYFRQFWDVRDAYSASVADEEEREEELRDINPMPQWTGDLGSNAPLDPISTGTIVLLIRGDLLKKFPNTLVFAAPSDGLVPENPVIDATGSDLTFPSFRSDLDEQTTALFFNISDTAARDLFFVLAERPGEPQFGLDFEDTVRRYYPTNGTPNTNPVRLEKWDDFKWGDDGANGQNLYPPNFLQSDDASGPLQADNSAATAFALFQKPFLVAVKGSQFLA